MATLCERIQAGEEKAEVELWRICLKFRPRANYLLFGDYGEDIISDIYIDLVRKIKGGQKIEFFHNFIKTIVRRKCAKFRQSHAFQDIANVPAECIRSDWRDLFPSYDYSPEDILLWKDRQKILDILVSSLPKREKLLFHSLYELGEDSNAVQKRFNITSRQYVNQKHRLIKQLQGKRIDYENRKPTVVRDPSNRINDGLLGVVKHRRPRGRPRGKRDRL